MELFMPGFIMGFREGLEAFLIVVIIIQYLNHSNNQSFKNSVYSGAFLGIIASIMLGSGLYFLSSLIKKTDEVAKIWESGTSFIALILITTFIIWMMKHGRNMVDDVQSQVKQNLSKLGLFSISFIMVVREGTEIAIFTFAGNYTLFSILMGISFSLVLALLMYYTLININIKLLFTITLAYLILQAGFLFGYSIHEGLSALKSFSYIDGDHFLFIKVFDFSATILDHKQGIIGLPLYALVGWYSRPEWIQFILQYLYTLGMFGIWKKISQKTGQ